MIRMRAQAQQYAPILEKARQAISEIHAKRASRKHLPFQRIVDLELAELLHAANKLATEMGLSAIETSEIAVVDSTSAGHVDYALKLALGVADLLYRRIP